MDKKILLLLFLVSGFAFSQTTVTLQDQCNCEVLSGTAVTSPGTTTPSGADTGDIYVNTNTGVIYFWDGDSWELTSSDDQQLQNFSFNSGTNILSLDIEDGNTVNVDLSSLSGTGTDDQLISLAGNILTLEDGGTVDLSPYLDNTDDQIITAFSINASNILTLTLENGNTQTVDLSGLVGTDDQLISLAGNILTLENGGNVDLTSYLDNTDDQIITAFSIDAGNILTLTLEDGNTQTVDLSGLVGTDDQTAAEVTYDNTVSGLTATDVQAAIDEINGLAGTVALVDNADGTYTFTDAGGNVTTISDTSISTMVDNLDGTYTYTDETGATQLIDTNASSNPYDNTVSGLTATDVQAAIDEINAAAGTVALVDNADGTYTFTDAGGNVTTISDTSISTMVDNLDGTYTYTDETGATQLIDTNASSNPYDNTVSGLTATDVQAAIDEINAAAGTVALVDNADGTYTFTDAGGNVTTISDTSISTMVDNLDGTYTYTDETGATQLIDTNASSNPYDNTVSGLTATDVQAAIDEINAAAGTVALVDNADGTYTFTDAGGNVTTISDTSISTMVDNLDGTYTYTDETGATQLIDTNASSNPYDNTVSGLTATDVQAAIDEINAAAGTVALVDNADGTYTFTDAGGNVTTISDTSISTMVDNLDGTYTYTDETGATQLIDTNASSNPYDNTVSGLTATDVQAAIDEINAAAGTVALVDNADGTYTFTDAGGNVTTISDTSISTMVDNLDGTYTYTDETGATQLIDTNASSNPYDNTVSGLTATDVQAAIDEINALAGTVALVDNLDGTYDFTDAAGNTTTISDTSISTLVDNLDGTYTYTDETGTTQLIDTNASSNPYDNTASGLTATDVQAAIDEINALAGTVALVDNLDGTYDFTDAAGNTTIISDTSISTLVDNGDGSFTYTDETGAVTIFTETLTTLVDNFNGTFTYTNEDGVAQIVSKSDIIDNFDGTYVFNNNDGSPETIDTRAISNPYDNTTSGLTATDVQAAIDEINGLAGTVALVDNLDGTYDFTDAAGNTTTISDTSISTLVDNLDGTYTYTDETGTTQIIDTNASSNPYDNTASGLTATDVQAALDELAAGSTDDQNISGSGLAGTDLTIGIENGTNEVVDLSSLVESVIAGTGAITVTDDGNGNYTVNSTDPDEDLTNELTLLGNGAPVVVPSNAGVTYVDTVAGQLYVWDGAVWNVVGGNASPDLDGDPANELNTAFAVNAGNLEITDNGGTLTVPLASLGTDDQTAAEVTYDNIVSGLTAIDVQAALDELAAGSTDDQTISTDGTAGNISIEDGNTIAININDADADATNEFNTGISFDGTNLTVTDAGGNQVVDISGVSTDDQDLTGASLSGANILQIDIENGGSTTVDLSALDDPGTDDQTAAEVTYDNIVSGLTAIDVQAALDELAAGSTDDQTISTDGTAGNISIEDGNTIAININDADADATNEYNTGISFDGSNLTVTDAGGNQVVDISGVSTDDQNISGSGLAGTDLTIGIENGTNEIVDLSSLVETVVAGTGAITVTDDGNGNYTVNSTDPDEDLTNELTLIGAGAPAVVPSNSGVTYVDSVAGQLYIWDGAVWSAVGGNASPDLDGDPTNEHNTSFAVNAGNLEITDGGGTLTVPLASLGTDDQTISTDGTAGNISIEDGNTIAININDADADATNEFNTGISFDGSNLTVTDAGGNQVVDISGVSTDDQNIESLAVDAGTNILTVGIENGTSQTVDLSHLDDAGTDDQTAAEVTYDNTTSGLTATEVQAAIDEVAAGSTDDQNISGSGLAGNILTIGIENGTNETVDLSTLVGTDDQNIESLAVDAGTNILTVGIEDGVSQTVDLSHLDDAGTDDQTISTDGSAGNISIEDGNTIAINVNDADADATNEYNTGLGTNAGALEVTDAGGTLSTTLISTDANNDIASGSDGALYLNVASVTISETITNLVDNANGTLTYTNENGVPQTVSKADITDNADGTYTFTNNDGSDVILDTNAGSNPYDNTISGLTATNVKAALDELASGSTDDQNIAGSGLAGNILTIGIENGTNETVDLSALVGTDDQNIESLAVDAGTNILTVGIEDGTSQTVDLSHLDDAGTDDQIASEVNITDAGGNFVSTEVEGALAELAAGSTDDQNIAGSGLAGNILTIGIENGTNETVDLSALVGTDDQNIESLAVDAGTNILTVGIEDGTSQTVDLSHLDDAGTDDQTAAEVTYDNLASGLTAIDVQAALDELAAGSTDDQNITGSGLAGNILTIGIENGTNETVDLSALVGTDDQNIESLAVDAGTNILTVGIEDGTSQTVDLSHLDDAGTDDQTAAEVTYDNLASGLTAIDVQAALDELAAGSTDDQNITGSGLAGNILTIGIENGTNETVDLSTLVGTDDQNLTLAANSLSIEDGNSVDLSPYLDNTDDQNITGSGLAGNILTIGIENGTNETVDLSALVGTDDQNIESLAVDAGTNILTVGIEDGTSQTVDLSHLDDAGTDDQIASEVNITDAGGNFVSTEVEGALAELAAGSTDDQNIAGSGLAGNILTIGIENGTNETVDLSALVGTDDQNIESLAVDAGTNILTVGIEDGTSQTVDLSHLDDAGTDDQNITGSGLAGNILTIGIENGTNETVDLSALVGTDDQIASEVNITDAGGNFVSTEVEGALAELAAGSTDDQNIAGSGLAGNILTIGIENGTNETVDLSALVGTDDQNIESLAVDAGTNILTVGIEDGTSQTVDLSHLDDAGTDDQNIAGSGLAGNILTIGIENGTNETVDLSALVGTDDQIASEVNITDAGGNFVSTEVEGALAELAAGSTDDQNIAGSGLAGNILTIGIENGTNETVDLSALVGTDDQNIESLAVDAGTNILTVGIEDGTSQTVDLSHLDDAGTDDQIASEVNITDAGGNFVSTEVEGALAELAAGSTDDQNIAGSGLAGNILTIGIENGTNETVDLSALVGTDDQNIESLAVDAGTNILTVGIEDGTSQTVDLSHLDDAGTDDQIASEVNITDAGGNFVSTEVEGALAELAAGSTDDQNIAGSGLAGNILTIGIENGTNETVDLSALVGTDDQNIESLAVDAGTNILTVGIEDGTSQTVDLSHLDDAGTDDQIASEVNITDAGGNFVSTEVEGALAELAAGSTDDQNIAGSGLAGNILTIGIENGTNETVDLSALVGTDDQNIESLAVDAGTNILTVGIEDGTSQTVDLSHLDDAGTDDQIASEVNITDAGGNFVSTEVEGALAELAAGSTDDQNIAGSGLAGNILTIGIENGTNETVDLSALVGTDDQNIESLAVDAGTNILTVGIEDGTSQTVDLSHLDDAGTDDQYDDEVLLRTPIDVDEGGVGSPTNETTVEEVIQAIAPITSKAARIFYPPSIAVDASTNGSFSIDLYAQYTAQFGTPTVASAGAPAAVPTYGATELYYYVTYADPTVFNTATMAIDGNGVLSYDIIGQPSDYNSLINVVFVVK